MGTLTQRTTRAGVVYTAQIRLKKNGLVVHSESKTFEKKAHAQKWMTTREAALHQSGVTDSVDDPPLATAVRKYLDESRKHIGRSKRRVLLTIIASPIGKIRCSAITSTHLIGWISEMECSPATRRTYLSHVSPVFALAPAAWKYPLDNGELAKAKAVLKSLGVVKKSKERTRRPTMEELEKLLKYFSELYEGKLPMVTLIVFSLFSGRRQSETCGLRWEDLEPGRILVRQMKDPENKETNDVWTVLTPEARRIIDAQPRDGDLIFPYKPGSISATFSRAVKFLQIPDLRFHDLRHETASWLAEMGWVVQQVAAVTGHKTWQSLERYSHVRQIGDRYADWGWLEAVSSARNSLRATERLASI